jgi:hypothetical protein
MRPLSAVNGQRELRLGGRMVITLAVARLLLDRFRSATILTWTAGAPLVRLGLR